MICRKCFIDLSTTQGYVDLVEKMNKAKDFLERHPALGGGSVFTIHDNLWYCAQGVCKRGYSKLRDGMFEISYTKENYKKYKGLFDIEFKEDPEHKVFARVSVPYEKHFGEPWKFDHIEYWGELGFVMFLGKNFKKYFDPKTWDRCAGIETSGRSFEELVINAAKEFKKVFGNFSDEDFLTEKEKENHKKEHPIFFVKCKEPSNCSQMKHNRKYISVTDAELNRRWLKWFAKTPYAKKNWKSTCKDVLSGKTNRY